MVLLQGAGWQNPVDILKVVIILQDGIKILNIKK